MTVFRDREQLYAHWHSAHFSLACTDLACFFYSLKNVIPGLERLCVLEGVDVDAVKGMLRKLAAAPADCDSDAELKTTHDANLERYAPDYAARAQAILEGWPSGACDLGCTAPPMGFSWSPFIAQCASAFISRSACPHYIHVVHKGKVTKMEGGAGKILSTSTGHQVPGQLQVRKEGSAAECLGSLRMDAADPAGAVLLPCSVLRRMHHRKRTHRGDSSREARAGLACVSCADAAGRSRRSAVSASLHV